MKRSKNYYAIIMAGGIGSRLWPISTQESPKQFYDVLNAGQTLIQRTFERINRLISSENILIATNELYGNLVLEQLPKTTKSSLLLEPVMRNTAPCILYATLKIYEKDPDAVILVVPADHWIDDEAEFLKSVRASFKNCLKKNILMTLGIKPDSPNTGYGYIQFDKESVEIKKVKNFIEKPNLETAKEFVKKGNYLWNAGIFIWSAKSILNSFKKHLPEMVVILDQKNVYNTNFEYDFIEKNYSKCENISIDFGIMEKAKNVYVLPVNFGWNDLGTWSSLYNKLKKDSDNNAIVGAKVISRNSTGNMIKTQLGKKLVIQGLKDYIIVEKENVLLICPKKDEQGIKQIVADVKKNFGEEFA